MFGEKKNVVFGHGTYEKPEHPEHKLCKNGMNQLFRRYSREDETYG